MKLLKSKTLWFAVLLAVGGILEQSQALVTQLVGQQKVAFLSSRRLW